MTGPQKQTLLAALQQLGPQNDSRPAHRNHWRIRLDNDAAIFEAMFDDSLLTAAQFRQRLASIYGVAVAQVTSSTSNPAVGTVLTLSYQSVHRLRVVLFGGVNATYQESGDAARAYLAANAAAWGDDE